MSQHILASGSELDGAEEGGRDPVAASKWGLGLGLPEAARAPWPLGGPHVHLLVHASLCRGLGTMGAARWLHRALCCFLDCSHFFVIRNETSTRGEGSYLAPAMALQGPPSSCR